MPWQVEQVTGATSAVIRCVWFNGYIYAFTGDSGVYRRDGVGPWTLVFNGGGLGWYWEDDDALYCTGASGRLIHRSEDGVNWPLDIDLNAAFGLQGSYTSWGAMGGYGNYFYYANHDVGATVTYFYRRDLAGNWDMPFATHAGAEGAGNRGVVGFGGEVYWTNTSNARRWDGAAWAIEPTLDAQGGEELSVLDDILYVITSTLHSLLGGYYWRTTTSTEWAFMNLPVPDNTWGGWALCRGADGENYALAQGNGTILRIYRQVGEQLNLIVYQASTFPPGLGTRGGICVDAAGDMYFGTNNIGTIQFFAFVPDHDLTPVGGGLFPEALDCDADGDSLYVAVYNAAGQPVLIRVMLPLTAASPGLAMFDPTDGDSINVRCSNVGGRLAIAGNFAAAGNEQVETSVDGALTWVDIDRDGWGAETAQPLLVGDNIEQIMVALQTAQDITETANAGATPWIVNNPAVAYSPIAAAKLPQGDEMILSGSGLGVDYSPNRGAELHDTGGPTDAVALEVV